MHVYLKEIHMENFKSFGKKMKLPLMEGYSCITGPNGSGKSNISDAILFVLGPRSSKAIRAGKLTDLIFNGGKSKKKARECKVSLIFDNSDRLIPYDSDIVKLTRHVKLSTSNTDGYSSYFYINEKKAKLSDFDALLSHARISADGYNLVQQGDITRIVEMGNLERRRVLDDISGITKFDQEIDKADKERTQTEENLDRIGIILDEINKQLRTLEKDRTSALKYKEFKERYDLARAQMTYKKKDSLEAEINSMKEQLNKYEDEKKKYEKSIKELRKELGDAKKNLAKVEDDIARKGGDEARDLKEKIDNLKIQIARAMDTVDNAKENQEEIKKERTLISKEMKRAEKELADLQEKYGRAEKTLKEKTKLLEEKQKILDENESVLAESDSKVKDIQDKINKLTKEIDGKMEEMGSLKVEQDRTRDRIERLKTEIAEMEETRKTIEFNIKDGKWQLKELKSDSKCSTNSLKKLQEEFYKKRNLDRKLTREKEELEMAIVTLTRQYNQLKAEADAADAVERGYTGAVHAILEARDKGVIKGIHGTIAELMDVEEEHETAIHVAAGNRTQSIIVDSDNVAAEAINFLKKNRIGRATFLPINKMLAGRPRGKAIMAVKKGGAVGFAIDLIKFDDKYRNAFWYVLQDTVIVENLDASRRLMGGVRLVTLDGQLTEASGAMVGGTAAKGVKLGAPSARKIDSIAEKLRKATEQSDKLGEELKRLRIELGELEVRLKEASGMEGSSNIKIDTLRERIEEFEKKLKGTRENLRQKEKELKESDALFAELEDKIDACERGMDGLKQRKEKLGREMLGKTPQEQARKLKGIQTDITGLAGEAAEAKASAKTLGAQVSMLEERVKEFNDKTKEMDRKRDDLKKRMSASDKSAQEFRNELNALLKVEESMGARISDMRKKRDEIYDNKTSIENDIDKLQIKMETKEDYMLGLKTKMTSIDEQLKEAAKEIEGVKLEMPEKLPSMDELRKTIAECEGTMNGMGAVNMKAIEDYDAQNTRKGELKEELKNLEKQRKKLIKLVDELNEKKKVGLLDVFGAINENFKRCYAELSGGGDAELVLENQENPFQGGLIMKARPKNKKVLRLEALSGGEKSLTALAFIFAIQQYDPSPFYLLDEVDMFLDAVNAENVAKTVKRNSASAQFVQISLRKVSLKEADHLIGVTMHDNGISDVVMRVNLREVPDAKEETKEKDVLKVEAETELEEKDAKGEIPDEEEDAALKIETPETEVDMPRVDVHET